MANQAHGSGGGGQYNDPYKGLVSGRIGTGGQRTFHCNFGSLKCGQNVGQAVSYIGRLDEFKDRGDLEHMAGDPEAVEQAAAVIEDSARIKRGPTAERVLVKMTFELPGEFDGPQRRQVADAFAARLKKSGFAAAVAVHGNGKVQPHVHVVVGARPVDKDGQIDRSFRWFASKADVQTGRASICSLINKVAGREIFHPGRLEDTGIDRPAKKRVPARQWAAGQREAEPAAIDLARQRREKERQRAKRERAERAKRRAARAIKTPVFQNVRKEADDLRRQVDRPADNEPASIKQIGFLQDLQTKRRPLTNEQLKALGISNADDALTKGIAGSWIRALQKQPVKSPTRNKDLGM